MTVAPGRTADAVSQVVPAAEIQPDQMGLDIGPDSARLFAARLAAAQTIFWNGPMGVFEIERYSPRHPGSRRRAHRQHRVHHGRRR